MHIIYINFLLLVFPLTCIFRLISSLVGSCLSFELLATVISLIMDIINSGFCHNVVSSPFTMNVPCMKFSAILIHIIWNRFA